MDISVDRYLDDGRTLLMTLALRSRTTEMHSVLTALDSEQVAVVRAALAHAVNEIAKVVQPVAEAMPPRD